MRQIKKDSTNKSVTIRIIDSSDGTPEQAVEHNSAGIAMWYRREGAAKTAITMAALAALTTAHTDGGIEHIDDGYYRFDIPDAAFATGATHVMIGGAVTGMIVIGQEVQLVDYDPDDAVRLGLTALPNAAADAAGGLPISDAGGLDLDTQLGTDIDAILADTNELQTDDVPGLIAALNDPTSAAIADAVWDEAKADHVGAGSFGEEVQAHSLSSEVSALNDISAADVNAQVLDVLNTDTFAEPGQESPPATTTLVKKLGYLYKFLRNKITNDGSTIEVYDDAGTTVDQKSTVSEAAGTVTRGEFATGP